MRCHAILSSSQEEEVAKGSGDGKSEFPVRKFPSRLKIRVLLNESDGRGMSINGTHAAEGRTLHECFF